MLQSPQILQRVFARYDKVCAFAGRDRAGHIADTRQLRVAQGGRVEGKTVAHTAVFVEVAQLPPEIVLSNVGAAYIVAQAHRDAVCQRGFCTFDHAVKDDLSVVLVFF